MFQIRQKQNFWRFKWYFWRKNLFLAYNPLFLALFRQIQSITFRQKQAFAKILCGRRTHFSRMQILIFPPPPPYSTTSSPPFHPLSPSPSQFFSDFFLQKQIGKSLRKAPETPEKFPWKTSLKTLPASSPHRKEKRGIPRKSFISGLLKGFGGGR